MQHAIPVTPTHIDAGIPIDPKRCPIALACREKFPNDILSVGNTKIGVHQNADVPAGHTYYISKPIIMWIRQYDRGDTNPVQPFTLVLDDQNNTAEIEETANAPV